MRAEIIAIGTELTTGQKLDTNSQWLSLQLADLGISVQYHTTVADDLEANVDVLRNAVGRADVVLITGGLGPTLDDLTREALARLVGVDLVLHEPSLAFIQTFFLHRGRAMPERNRSQALLPAGSAPLANPIGTAPGIWMELVRAKVGGTSKSPHVDTQEGGLGSPPYVLIAAMPGVPSEMYKMFLEQVRPRLPRNARLIRRAQINCFGLGESHTEELLGDLTARGRDPEIGITAHEATISLRIVAHGATEAECQRKIDAARAAIEQRLGHYVYGAEDEELEDVVLRELAARGQTLATAEAGTGGLLAQWLTAVNHSPGAYLGGVVVPTEAARRALLGVTAADGAVSADVAGQMVSTCRERFQSDYALAITQYPRIDPAVVMSSAPAAWLALAHADGVSVQDINLGGNPAILRSRTAKSALNVLRLRLRQ
jgi:nicotinamide-nucleotide amidase